ncbi:MAG: hypothetical protein LF885_05025 [Rickettsia endosymbiont of Culicoides impunctatus]|uniref:hypothetical protein n=1 Tax=unclassified Candidatus Tisiphia TaxID=2996318 RepID=UPI001E7931A8|nr:MAG: hypothetical protein LF885_05025 [Rickettsia endosymbiont of Culicoides impunctatus]
MVNWNSYTTVVAATIVDNLDTATEYYDKIFNAKPLYQIDHIQEYVDLKDILKNSPVDVTTIDASVRFLNLGFSKYVYEIAKFHNLKYDYNNSNSIIMKFYVDDLSTIFERVKSEKNTNLLSNPNKLSTIFSPCRKFEKDIKFFVDEETKHTILSEASNNLGGFIFVDKYKVQWEILGEINGGNMH